MMTGMPGFFDVDERLRRLSELGDQLEAHARAVDFEAFRPVLDEALSYSTGSQGGRPPYDPVLKAGRIPRAWKERPAKLRHKDRDARWTVKFTKAKPQADGTLPPVDIAIPAFGYQNHIAIDREHGLIRRGLVTDAAAYEGARLREGLLDPDTTARTVWADTAYRSAAHETFLGRHGLVSRIHRKKPKGRPMPAAIRGANDAKSKIRSRVEHVFAEQKTRMGLFVRTIGLARARTRIGMANLVHNMRRLAWLTRTAAAWHASAG
jgi:transposase, IS5 family